MPSTTLTGFKSVVVRVLILNIFLAFQIRRARLQGKTIRMSPLGNTYKRSPGHDTNNTRSTGFYRILHLVAAIRRKHTSLIAVLSSQSCLHSPSSSSIALVSPARSLITSSASTFLSCLYNNIYTLIHKV